MTKTKTIKKGKKTIKKPIIEGKIKERPFVKMLKAAYRKKRRQIAVKYKKAQRPIRRKITRRPMRLKRAPIRRGTISPPTQITSVRQLQRAPPQVLASFLNEREINELNRLMPSARRVAAIQIASRRLKEQQIAFNRANPQMIRSVDPFNSNRIIEKREVPIERYSW